MQNTKERNKQKNSTFTIFSLALYLSFTWFKTKEHVKINKLVSSCIFSPENKTSSCIFWLWDKCCCFICLLLYYYWKSVFSVYVWTGRNWFWKGRHSRPNPVLDLAPVTPTPPWKRWYKSGNITHDPHGKSGRKRNETKTTQPPTLASELALVWCDVWWSI